MRWWEKVSWAGACAFVMASSLSIGFAVGLVMSASPRTPPINETTATLLATLGGAMGGSVATYIGLSASRKQPPSKEDE
jgi:hypothetical protein